MTVGLFPLTTTAEMMAALRFHFSTYGSLYLLAALSAALMEMNFFILIGIHVCALPSLPRWTKFLHAFEMRLGHDTVVIKISKDS